MTTQQDCSVGLGIESTWGTAVTPTRWLEFQDEKFEWAPTFVQGDGLRVGGQVSRGARRATGKIDAKGTLDFEVYSKGLGLFLQCALGAATSTLVSTGLYQQLYTPAASDVLPSATIQKGIPPIGGGATVPHTFPGSVCTSLELGQSNGALLIAKTVWSAQTCVTSTAYAAPSYATSTGEVFSFSQVSSVIGTAAAGLTVPTATTLGAVTTPIAVTGITDFSMKVDNKLDAGGFRMNGTGLRSRSPVVGLRQVSGSITSEFDNVILRDAFINQTPLCATFTWVGKVAIPGAASTAKLQIAIPYFMLEGDIPNSNKGQTIMQTIPYTVLDGGVAAAPVYVAIQTGDAAL